MSKQTENLAQQIREYCVVLGSDALLVQGAGGNVSWKDGDTLWIKASGYWLAQALAKEMFLPVRLSQMMASINRGDYTATPEQLGLRHLRPSLEVMLHAVMPHKIVVHLHAVEVLAWLVRDEDLSGFELGHLDSVLCRFVDYAKPGGDLAATVHHALKDYPDTNVLLLRNHGVVIGGDSVQEVDRILRDLCSKYKSTYLSSKNGCDLSLPKSPVTAHYHPVADQMLHQLAVNDDLFKYVEDSWALYPDHVVFLGPTAHAFPSWDDFLNQSAASTELPELLFIKGSGVFVSVSFTEAKVAQLRCYYDVLVRQPEKQKLRPLTRDQVADILDWEPEHYRQGKLVVRES